MTSDTAVAAALSDLVRAARLAKIDWVLVGGQALIAYGIPRETLDADLFAAPEDFKTIADVLVETFDWTPLAWDYDEGDYTPTKEATILYMEDDPVLSGRERHMIALRSPFGLLVEILSAQCKIEQEMIYDALPITYQGVRVPVAPLGGVLLVKTKAHRLKDWAAIEQVGEHISTERLRVALEWAKEHDRDATEDLRSIMSVTRQRKTPKKKNR